MINIDIVILSYAKNYTLQKVTENAILSLKNSENQNEIFFNVLVIESNSSLNPFNYSNSKTIYPKGKFNFNAFLNIGIKNTQNNFICFCNNDLIFHKNWASEIIKQFNIDDKLMSASPICSIYHPTINIMPNSGNYYGHEIRKEIAGWCIFVKRSIFNKIGLFDEKFEFWFSDSDYAKTLQKFNQKHLLVSSSIVDHLDGTTTAELDNKKKLAFTTEQYWYFQYKWEHKNYFIYLYRKLRSKLRIFKKSTK